MSIPQIRKKSKLFFRVFALLFAVAYFSPAFSYVTPRPEMAHAVSIDAFVIQSGAALVSAHQQFCKITGFDYFIFDLTPVTSAVEAAAAKVFFISQSERNVFYVFTTINAP